MSVYEGGDILSGGDSDEDSTTSAGEPDCLASTSIEEKHHVTRRIYPTHFKLAVLDSYRSDQDCLNNQRATARKFGIHRRQIQKWLLSEKNLRSGRSDKTIKMIHEDMDEPIALNLCIKSSHDNLNNNDHEIDVVGDEDIDHVPLEHPWTLHPHTTDHFMIQHDAHEQQTPSPSTSSVTSGKRRSFTLQFKLDVLNAFYSNDACKGNQRATARLFGINRRQVQKWLCQEVQLRSEAALSASTNSTTSTGDESSAKRQRLGRWLWTVPHWTMAHWQEETSTTPQPLHPTQTISVPNFLPPQDTALCLVKVEKNESAVIKTSEEDSTGTNTTETSISPKPKRHSYPLDFKLQALDAYHEDLSCRGNQRAVAKRFSIHRRQVQKWLKQETQLRQRLALTKDTTTSSRISIRSPAVLKPMQVVSQQSSYTWMEEMQRTPAPCWS